MYRKKPEILANRNIWQFRTKFGVLNRIQATSEIKIINILTPSDKYDGPIPFTLMSKSSDEKTVTVDRRISQMAYQPKKYVK